jgi:hypothetical protein
MTKKELIELLKDVPDDYEIVYENQYDMVLNNVTTWEDLEKYHININYKKGTVELL